MTYATLACRPFGMIKGVTLPWLYLSELTAIQSVSDQQECLECSKQMLLVCYFTQTTITASITL